MRNRKWTVGSSTNMRDALAFLIQKKPQFILISADHPNKKVRILPKMLAQAFPIRVIGFAEKASGNSSKLLQDMGLEYNLYPPVSGPAIERMVLKIRKEDELKAQQTFDNPDGIRLDGASNSNSSIMLKGAASPESLSASFEQARAALSQLISSDSSNQDDDPKLGLTADEALAKSGLILQENLGGHVAGAAYKGGAGNPNQSPQSTTQGGSQSGFQAKQDGNIGSSQPGHVPQQGQSGSQLGFLSGESNWESPDSSSVRPPDSNPASRGTSQQSSPELKNSTSNDPGQATDAPTKRNLKTAPVMESEYLPKEKKANYKLHQDSPTLGRDRNSIIVRGTQAALDQTVNRLGPEKVNQVKQSSNLACITIDSPKFSGYLVCAMGQNRPVDKSLIDLIQKRLFSFLIAHGEKLTAEDTMDLKIQEVDFSDWALEQAEFLKKSIHEGDEIAIAFFPTQKLNVPLADSVSQKMLKMSLSDIQDETALEFDLYIFMPQNNKYLLYTPKGRPIYGQQKSRLQEKGVTHMHLRKDSAHQVKKYQAQNFLNEKIKIYKSKASA